VISARRVTKYRGVDVVLRGVSLSVGPLDRVGVVGRNGIGKTTLLRVLAGLEEPDEGSVRLVPETLAVGYLSQEPDAAPGETVLLYLPRLAGVAEAEQEMMEWARRLDHDPNAADAYATALDRFLHLSGGDFDARAATVSRDVGLGDDRLDQPVDSLSGGQAARAGLAAILLSRYDVVLLDEPTNDLDFDGLDRLEAFVGGATGGVVIVSHDRDFLERTVERVVEIEEGTHTAREYGGGFSEYLRMREAARRARYEAHEQYVEEKERLGELARRQKVWSEGGVRRAHRDLSEPDKRLRFKRMQGAENFAARAKMVERRLERLDKVDKPWEGWQLALSLAPSARSGDLVVRLDGAVVDRGSFRLGPLDVEIGWQERVVVLGRNGSGKTTLLHALLGRLPLSGGERRAGPSVVFGNMDQARALFDGSDELLPAFIRHSGLLPEAARSLLAKFDLGAGDVERPVRTLSAGERTRAVLGLLTAGGVNCLVLDEPTNHLDLPAIEQLEDALAAYEGTLVLVTHDRRLLENIEITRTIEL